MAYDPLRLACYGQYSAPGRMPGVSREWTYQSDDAMTTVRVLNYISDAYYRNMQVGDAITVVTMSAGAVSTTYRAAVMAVIAAGADISNGTSIDVTNSD